MEIPQALPIRRVRLETQDPDAVAAVQPERRRSYQQISRGAFRGTVIEQSFGCAALLDERWSCGVRVRCGRAGGYTAFALPAAAGGEVRWCGDELAPGAVLRVDEPWEMATAGSFAFLAFGVDGAALAAAELQLAGGEERSAAPGNRVMRGVDVPPLLERLRVLLRALSEAPPHAAALAVASADLMHLAATLDRVGGRAPVGRLSPPSQRRAAVARIEEYLDAQRGAVPSIPALCGIAGVSERTLEYAFREHVGVTPVRYLKLRRLNQVRRALRARESAAASVTEIALRAGFYDLGRFAGEYRALFGELPSQTLADGRGRLGVARLEPDSLPATI
jgi:AraC family ethanolamine operon transcriptional activator